MKRTMFITTLLLVGAPFALAQSTGRGSIEGFVGYSNLEAKGIPNTSPGSTVPFSNGFFGERASLNGANAEVSGYFTPWIGLTGDFSWNQRNRGFNGGTDAFGNPVSGSLRTRVYEFMGGPTVAYRTGRINPFARVLAGVANTNFRASTTSTATAGGVITTTNSSFTAGATDFSMAFGGGLDIRATEHIAVRVFQVDYNPVWLRNRSINVLSNAGALVPETLNGRRQDNVRFSFGVTFK